MWGGLRTVIITLVYLGIGVIFFRLVEEKECEDASFTGCMEPWTVIDALYFSVVTFSTVGYGDLTPSTSGSKVFTLIYIFVGITVVFSQIASGCAGRLEAIEHLFLRRVDRFDKSAAVSGQQLGISGEGLDISGNGRADFIAPPRASVFWGQRLAPWIVLSIALQGLSAALFTVVEPGLTYSDAFYHSFVTATTVGYGDVSLTTQGARLFAVLHVIISVTFFAALVGRVQELLDRRRAELKRADIFRNQVDENWMASIFEAKLDKDGQGIDKLEFVVGMLTRMGVELCGEPLAWTDIQPLLIQFEAADKTKDGRLNKDDLRKIAKDNVAKRKQKEELASKTFSKSQSKVAPDVQFSSLSG